MIPVPHVVGIKAITFDQNYILIYLMDILLHSDLH